MRLLKKKKEATPEGEDYDGMDEDDLEPEEQENLKPKQKKVQRPKKRYVAFQTPGRVGIVDTETDEVIAEGEFATLETLANILERLERMETTMGSLIE